MKMSQSISSLAAAMAKAQSDMGAAHKGAKNPAFNSTYADLASVIDAVKGHLSANGIAFLQFVQTSPEGVGVETLLTHASGEYVVGDPFFVPVAKANAHGFGSALTYARRYSLAAVCGLKAEDDDGNAAAASPPPAKSRRIPANIEGEELFASLSEEGKQIVREWAMEAIGLVKKGEVAAANDFLHRKCQTDEDKMMVWYCLPSDVRTPLLKVMREQNAKKYSPQELASQP